jgi:uncharacterized damage-inducible protein DinB
MDGRSGSIHVTSERLERYGSGMTRPILADAFDHHLWATLQVIDACGSLTPTQLETAVPGTYGSILATMRHLAGADVFYLTVLAPGRVGAVDEDVLDLEQLRGVMIENRVVWDGVIAGALDPDLDVVEVGEGWEFHAPLGVRLAQALLHGADHRSQVCTALTSLGVEPPLIDLWDFAEAHKRSWPVVTAAAPTD